MSNSTASDAAAESAQYDFLHGLQEFCIAPKACDNGERVRIAFTLDCCGMLPRRTLEG